MWESWMKSGLHLWLSIWRRPWSFLLTHWTYSEVRLFHVKQETLAANFDVHKTMVFHLFSTNFGLIQCYVTLIASQIDHEDSNIAGRYS